MNPCKSLLLRLFVIHGALTLFLFEVADAARFTSPSQNSDRFVFLGDDVTFEWVYQLDNPSTSYSIQCGYRETTPRWVLTKDGNNAAAVTTTFRNRVDKLSEQNNRIGFKLKQCQFNDAGNLGCQLIVNGLPEYSYMFQLKIYERPRYIDCLGPAGTVFILNEGQPINSTCTYYGNPQPTLRCQALDANGQSVRATSPDTFTGNLTGSNRLILNDIQRTVKTVKCTATNGQTGNVGVQTARAEQIRQVTVYYPPTAPVNLILMKSTHSTISVRWEQPKETGNRAIITYYVETVNPTGLRNGTNVTIFNNPSKIDYTIRYLQSKVKYTVNVYAYNSVGRGNLASGTFETVIYTRPETGTRSGSSSNAGLIAGLVVGGIALLIIIVLLAVYFYRKHDKQEKKYPTSFVEEAVDYPPTDPNMYAHVNKKRQPAMQEQNSTSGYPDIIHQAKGNSRAVPSEKEMLRTGSSDDHSISPSYESSKKEYV